jgi:hypothetical protein
MSRTSSDLHRTDYFQPEDDYFAGYEDFLDDLAREFASANAPADLDETPTPSRSFRAGDVRPWELPAADCPVCGSRLEDGAPVCVKCLEDALVFEGDCLACSGAPALSHSGLCQDCTRWACEREDEAARREVERQRKEMYQ